MKRSRDKIAADFKPKKQWSVEERREYYRRALKRHRIKSKQQVEELKGKTIELETQVKELKNTLNNLTQQQVLLNETATTWSDDYLFSQNSYMSEELCQLRLRRKLLSAAIGLQTSFPDYNCENIYQRIFWAEKECLKKVKPLKRSKRKEDELNKALVKRDMIYVKTRGAGSKVTEFLVANKNREECSTEIFKLFCIGKREYLVNFNSQARSVQMFRDNIKSGVKK
eukprot:snap_masked-scaffold_41-processed-gene-2.81-mRNA-1 protein AED:1.00 eAED:1.00 QI:0/0/0/0/1/1/2/0/225